MCYHFIYRVPCIAADPLFISLAAHWNEMCKSDQSCLGVSLANIGSHEDPYYFQQVSEFARTWVADRIRFARARFQATNSPFRESVLAELLEIENAIPDMKYAFE